MNLSFAWTTEAFLSGRKTCTRRPHWAHQYFDLWVKAWREGRRRHQAWDKNARWGGKRIGSFRLTCEPYLERLCDMPVEDLEAEGGLWDTVEEFIELQGVPSETLTPVLRFEMVEE